MRRHAGLQSWLESGAEGPAFVAVLVCMVLRSAQFYSGGAFSVARLLGPAGMHWFDLATGLGIAVGAELLMSIAGRARRRYIAELRDVQGRRGLTKTERAAMMAHFRDQARWSGGFCAIGAVASTIGAMSFLLSANANHSPGALLVEITVSGLLVAVTFFFGVVKENIPADPGQLASEQAVNIRFRLTDEAGRRIAEGRGTPQDVRLVAESLPKSERPRFRAVLAPDRDGDPLWTAGQIADWLGDRGDITLRRRISRRLRDAEAHGEDIRRDERGAYVLRRSLVLQLFAGDFMELRARDTQATAPRREPVIRLVPERSARDTDATATVAGHSEVTA